MNTYSLLAVTISAFIAGYVTSWAVTRFTIMILKNELKKVKRMIIAIRIVNT